MVACNVTLKITGSIPISINIKTAKLIADIKNERTTRLSGEVKEADIIDNGDGAVAAYDLKSPLIRVKNNAAAVVEVYGSHDFKMDNRDRGHIYYKGEGTVSELNETIKGTICREEYSAAPLPVKKDIPTKDSIINGFNRDSLFRLMMARDQQHRGSNHGDSAKYIHEDDAENFICLKWYFEHFGYPHFSDMEYQVGLGAMIMHIDNYENFMQLRDVLLRAVMDGNLLPSTYAYACDRSMIAKDHDRPRYFYFFPGSDWDLKYKPTTSEFEGVNKLRKEIGLPSYPGLLNGKYF